MPANRDQNDIARSPDLANLSMRTEHFLARQKGENSEQSKAVCGGSASAKALPRTADLT